MPSRFKPVCTGQSLKHWIFKPDISAQYSPNTHEDVRTLPQSPWQPILLLYICMFFFPMSMKFSHKNLTIQYTPKWSYEQWGFMSSPSPRFPYFLSFQRYFQRLQGISVTHAASCFEVMWTSSKLNVARSQWKCFFNSIMESIFALQKPEGGLQHHTFSKGNKCCSWPFFSRFVTFFFFSPLAFPPSSSACLFWGQDIARVSDAVLAPGLSPSAASSSEENPSASPPWARLPNPWFFLL